MHRMKLQSYLNHEPSHRTKTGSHQKKKKVEAGLGLCLRPSLLNLFWAKSVFGKTHPYANPFYFIPFCFDIWSNKLLFYIIRFQKNSWIFLNLFMCPDIFFMISLYNSFVDFYCKMWIFFLYIKNNKKI
jgi:hypothetical protein